MLDSTQNMAPIIAKRATMCTNKTWKVLPAQLKHTERELADATACSATSTRPRLVGQLHLTPHVEQVRCPGSEKLAQLVTR